MFDLSMLPLIVLFILFYYFIYKIGILNSIFKILKDAIICGNISVRQLNAVSSIILIPIIVVIILIYLFFTNNKFENDKRIQKEVRGLYYVSGIEDYNGRLELRYGNKCVLNESNNNCNWTVKNSIINITGNVNGKKINIEAQLGNNGIIINNVLIEMVYKY